MESGRGLVDEERARRGLGWMDRARLGEREGSCDLYSGEPRTLRKELLSWRVELNPKIPTYTERVSGSRVLTPVLSQ